MVCVARGAPSPVHGVCGMAGAGETTALIGLAHDRKIKDQFVDGVLYVSLRANTAAEHIMAELSKIMRVTGAVSSAKEMQSLALKLHETKRTSGAESGAYKKQSSSSLAAAISYAAIWFQGKRILFLVDDIWPTSKHPEGFFPDLLNILQGSPGSQMVISTRSRIIAVSTGSHVDFGARDPQGPLAVAMFISHAAPSIQFDEDQHVVVREILARCAGLPIAIAFTGAGVAQLVSYGLGFLTAGRTYFQSLVNEIDFGASVLDSAISMSLAFLEEMADNAGSENHPYTLRELYTSLCALAHPEFIPVSILSEMWSIDTASAMDVCMRFCSLSLANMSSQRSWDDVVLCGLQIHDLQMDFCHDVAERSGTRAEWGDRLSQAWWALGKSLRVSILVAFHQLTMAAHNAVFNRINEAIAKVPKSRGANNFSF